ncbi:MAG TPA: single-stranded-DNA-specific exonuclease RecJ [Candidatus Omnitrophica bacterium]|nr:MAG: single-stranded-DNA-specific exonuclease RecJ [Omnitrophica WOR_2 bacterium GWA2_63_20]OGX35306.1 MAG: single-stranded-DNA-specific exonuclease RecJ [Omnitrophica WOR_2 bacterium RIFCSPHIGHO2_02_FULL_63_39]OGX49346.1 MAG: single-stranded-DNA-specific exonuclease RecJ [Omnitrophica WOR_2 bacterium RIFCSPLOWO2_12_FULL_63_16]HBH96904.1 single-stranded-DNA-specific exonuclease RecJ [Candidatus Omnitrophota bacterium]HBQ38870.1 single-stranded-DNA-specific exonuclease RecJ [Candidatus Omnitr
MSSRSVWQVVAADPVSAHRLAQACGLPPLVGQFLLNRGLAHPAGVERFFAPTLDSLDDPRHLPDLPKAVARIRRAMAARTPILVFGDSDADGITASAIVFECLASLGARVAVRISNRLAHGYGFPKTLISEAARAKTGLMVLVDCGTNQAEEIRELAKRGIETIVLDHHLPTADLAHPAALVNPHAHETAGKELCSAGLAFKLAQALWGTADERLVSLSELAAIGTLADCAPLVGDNRILVVLGLRRLLQTHRPGLRLLCQTVGLTSATPEQVLQRLTPCLNAAGRLGDAQRVWRLLVESSLSRAKPLIRAIRKIHAASKALHRKILSEAHEQAGRLHLKDHAVVVIGRQGWHPGFMGPVAAQLADRFERPAIAIAMDDQTAVGSGRSFGMMNLLEALRACEGVLLRYGGHARACGLTLSPMNLERFREQINRYAQAAELHLRAGRMLQIDVQVALQEITPEVASSVERFAPFGVGNGRPLVMLRQVRVEEDAGRAPWVTDGRTTRRIWGKRLALRCDEGYDLVGSPRLINGDAAVSLREARLALTELSEPARA